MPSSRALVAAVVALLSYVDRSRMRRAHAGLPRYRTYGNPALPPVVLIPGLDGCASFYAGALPELTLERFVVVYELPLVSAANREEYTFSYLAKGLADVLDELDIDAAPVVGESFGGVVAMHAALEHETRVTRLLLLSSLAKTELTTEVWLKKTFALPVVRLIGRAFPNVAQTIFAYVHASDVVEASEPEWVTNFFIKEASWAHHASVMQRIKIVAGLDIEDRVPSITAPVLLIRGADDTFTGHTTARLRALLQSRGLVGTFPDGAVDVVTLPGGHLPHVTSSGLFARAVRDALFVFQMQKMPESEWHANDVQELNKNPFFNTTDVDIALTSTGYVSWRAVEELKK